jgi:hypothetical protein
MPLVEMAPRKGQARMSWIGSTSSRARAKCWLRRRVAAVCVPLLDFALSAAEPALARLAVSKGEDIRVSPLTRKDGLSPGQVRDILQDNQGFLWFNISGFPEPIRRLQLQILYSRCGPPELPGRRPSQLHLQRSARVSLDQLQRRARSVRSHQGNFQAFHDRARQPAQSPRAGLAHQPGPGRTSLAVHPNRPVPARPGDREGTLWVCALAGLDTFDRDTGKVTERIVPARIAYEKFSTNNGWRGRLGRRLGLTAPNREA